MTIRWPSKCNVSLEPEFMRGYNEGIEACKAAVAEAKGEEVNIKDATRFDKGMEKLREYTDKKYGDVKHECDTIDKSNGEELVPSHLEPPDYETPLNRAFLENKISEWYDKKFAHETKRFKTVSVFDLIADFIMDTGFGQPKPRKLPTVEDINNIINKFTGVNGEKLYSDSLARAIHSLLEERK